VTRVVFATLTRAARLLVLLILALAFCVAIVDIVLFLGA
jgi:hypothetical protein